MGEGDIKHFQFMCLTAIIISNYYLLITLLRSIKYCCQCDVIMIASSLRYLYTLYGVVRFEFYAQQIFLLRSFKIKVRVKSTQF